MDDKLVYIGKIEGLDLGLNLVIGEIYELLPFYKNVGSNTAPYLQKTYDVYKCNTRMRIGWVGNISEYHYQTKFITLAEWRDKQIKEILNG